jgi:hypothetical protein
VARAPPCSSIRDAEGAIAPREDRVVTAVAPMHHALDCTRDAVEHRNANRRAFAERACCSKGTFASTC